MCSLQNKISAVNRFYLNPEAGGFTLGGASKKELPVVGRGQGQISGVPYALCGSVKGTPPLWVPGFSSVQCESGALLALTPGSVWPPFLPFILNSSGRG